MYVTVEVKLNPSRNIINCSLANYNSSVICSDSFPYRSGEVFKFTSCIHCVICIWQSCCDGSTSLSIYRAMYSFVSQIRTDINCK